jgi:hypothetical protein
VASNTAVRTTTGAPSGLRSSTAFTRAGRRRPSLQTMFNSCENARPTMSARS